MQFSLFLERFRARIRPYGLALAVLVVAPFMAFGISWLGSPSKLSSLWQSINTTSQSQGYTELFFNNSTHLPVRAATDGSVSFSFALHNVESEALTYKYLIIVKNGSATAIIDRGSIYLHRGGRTSHTENVLLGNSTTSRQQISVLLVAQKQSISFWLVGAKS
jgi:hypothetical protein